MSQPWGAMGGFEVLWGWPGVGPCPVRLIPAPPAEQRGQEGSPPTQDDAVGCCGRLPDELHRGRPHFGEQDPHGGAGHWRGGDGDHPEGHSANGARPPPLGVASLGKGIAPGGGTGWLLAPHGPPELICVFLLAHAPAPTVIQRPLEDGGPAGHAVADPGEGQHADLVQHELAQPRQLGAAGRVALRQPELSARLRVLLLVHHLPKTLRDTAGTHPPVLPGWSSVARTGTGSREVAQPRQAVAPGAGRAGAAGAAHLVAQDEAVAVGLGDVAPSHQHAAGGGGQRRHVAGAGGRHWKGTGVGDRSGGQHQGRPRWAPGAAGAGRYLTPACAPAPGGSRAPSRWR